MSPDSPDNTLPGPHHCPCLAGPGGSGWRWRGRLGPKHEPRWGRGPGPGGEGDWGLQREVLEAPQPLGRRCALQQLLGVRGGRGAWAPASRAAPHRPVCPAGSARRRACSSGAACLPLRSLQSADPRQARGGWPLVPGRRAGGRASQAVFLTNVRCPTSPEKNRQDGRLRQRHRLRAQGTRLISVPTAARGAARPADPTEPLACVFPPRTEASDHRQHRSCLRSASTKNDTHGPGRHPGETPHRQRSPGRGRSVGRLEGRVAGDPGSEQGGGGGCSG